MLRSVIVVPRRSWRAVAVPRVVLSPLSGPGGVHRSPGPMPPRVWSIVARCSGRSTDSSTSVSSGGAGGVSVQVRPAFAGAFEGLFVAPCSDLDVITRQQYRRDRQVAPHLGPGVGLRSPSENQILLVGRGLPRTPGMSRTVASIIASTDLASDEDEITDRLTSSTRTRRAASS